MLKLIAMAALACPFVGLSAAVAAPPTEQGLKVAAPPAVTDQDVVGQWHMGAGFDNDWDLIMRPDHTLTAQFSGVFVHPQVQATWKLTGDRLEVSKQLPQFYPSLAVVRYKSSVVLLPQANREAVRRSGYSPDYCFWQYTLDKKKGLLLPHDAADFMKTWTYRLPTAP